MTNTLIYRYVTLRHRIRQDVFFLAYLLGYTLIIENLKYFQQLSVEIINTFRFTLVLEPRGFFKTSLLTVTRNVWKTLQNPNRRGAISSYSGENARAMLSEVASHFLVNDSIRFLFPEICPDNVKRPETYQWNKDGITVKRQTEWKEATIEAFGYDQSVTSRHYDEIDVDDLVQEHTTNTVAQIEKCDAYLQSLFSLLNLHDTKSCMSVKGTYWAPDDTHVKIEKGLINAPDGSSFVSVVIHEKYNERGTELASYPELFPLSLLKGLEDTPHYDCFYAMDPINTVNSIWKEGDIAYYEDYNLIPPDLSFHLYGAIDPAISERDVNSRSDTAISIIGVDSNNELWILDYILAKGAGTIVRDIFHLYNKWKDYRSKATPNPFRFFSVEVVAFQKILMRDLRKEMQERGQWIPLREDRPMSDKTARIMILDPLMRNKALHVKRGMAELVSQITRFGRKGQKVDLLDAIAQAYKASQFRITEKAPRINTKIDWSKARLLGGMR